MHDSRVIANRFLDLAAAENRTLTPMQVLKLVYIAHGWDLGLYGDSLVRDSVEAWRYGPVIPNLYNAVRKYKSAPVTERLAADPNDPPLSSREESLITDVYRLYGKKGGIELSRITHAPGTPWAQTYVDGEFSVPIPRDLIQEHYRQLAVRAKTAA